MKEFECQFCHNKFSSEDGLKHHQAAKHPQSEEKVKEKKKSNVVKVIIVILILSGAVFGLYRLIGSAQGDLPAVGAHWHAQYEIDICGEKVSQFPYSQGDVHTHGDGIIHIHPQSESTAKENANLGRFMLGTGGAFNSTYLKLPDGREFKNGDLCGTNPAQVRLFVTNRPNMEFEKYVPKDGQVIRIEFS
ncbi:MAG: hypothetical protein AABX59_04010 [Nanoarchaeota archaeon]